jgi:carboxyl-terminal processing protease
MQQLFFILLGAGIGVISAFTLFFREDVSAKITQYIADTQVDLVSQDIWTGTANLYQQFDTVHQYLERYFYHDMQDRSVMIDAAIKGYVSALDDPFTNYLSAEETSSFEESMAGSQDFEWIWAVVTKKPDGVMIEEVLKWSPAFEADLMPLDLIVEINGTGAVSLWLQEAVNMIRGPKGTPVLLKVYRESLWELLDVAVTRDAISVPSVQHEILSYSGMNQLYIEVSIIGEDTISKLKQTLGQIDVASVDGIILDLRGNGGGYLPIAVDFLGHFVNKWIVLVTAKYKVFEDEVFPAPGPATFVGKPLVVLIDGMSASASEIIALALAEYADATLVGTKSFGKWSIQTVQAFESGGMLKYTIGRWYVAEHENVDKIGITPDIEVPMTRDEYRELWDIQLQSAQTTLFDRIAR